MSKCSDPNVGKLLHAYELYALSEEDTERFEIHLLDCEHCYKELKAFEEEARLLTSDDDVKRVVKEAAERPSESLAARLWRRIWPETPLVFKPALAYLIILLMIVPAYLGLRKPQVGEIGPPQIITLIPDRSAAPGFFDADLPGEGLIRFMLPGAVVARSYLLVIESEDGTVVYRNDKFDSFDENGWGELAFPHAKMKPGYYRLVVTDPGAEPPRNRREYSFKIE